MSVRLCACRAAGEHVLLNVRTLAAGEHGILNDPGCDVSTTAAAALLFVPVDTAEEGDPAATLEEFEAAVAEGVAGEQPDGAAAAAAAKSSSTQLTATALRRRVSSLVRSAVHPRAAAPQLRVHAHAC
jgi:hypothetical protein